MLPRRGICAGGTEVIDKSQASLEALIRFAPLAILELNPEGNIISWNPSAEQMFGWMESEVSGRIDPTIPPENRAEHEADVVHLLEGATIRGKKDRRQGKDGRWIDVRLWAAPIHNQENQITGITAFLEDITGQKENERKPPEFKARGREVEAELQRNEERMRLALDAAKAGFWDWDLVTGEMVWSAAANRQMGRPDDAPTSFEIFMDSVHPDDRTAVQETVEAALKGDKNPSASYRMVWPDGSLHWRAVAGRVIRDHEGHPVRMLGIGLDLDDSHTANEHMLLQAAALQAAANSIVITDNQGTILWTNQAFSQLTGYSGGRSPGKKSSPIEIGATGQRILCQSVGDDHVRTDLARGDRQPAQRWEPLHRGDDDHAGAHRQWCDHPLCRDQTGRHCAQDCPRQVAPGRGEVSLDF